MCPNGGQIQFLGCQIWQFQVGGFAEVDVFADKTSVVSADKTSVVSADKTSVVSADKTSVVSADISQDIPQTLWTEGRPPLCTECGGDVLGDVC